MIDQSEREAVLEVSNLSKRYGSLLAVDGVSFRLDAGEILGLLGPNGAGKTSILEMIEGLREPDTGLIEVLGASSTDRRKATRSRLGVQLQASAMLPNLTVAELLTLQASFYPRPLDVREVLTTIGLTDKTKTISGQLSGGQLQRLAIGLALIGNPDLVLLDEPTTGLDPAARRELWTVLEDLRSAGKSILLTTHYMEEAEALCDRVAILDQGRLVALGTVSDLAALRGGDRIVFSTEPDLDAISLSRLPGVTDVAERNGLTALMSTNAAESLLGLIQLGQRKSHLPQGLAVRHPTLEEIYLELTGHSFDAASAA